MVPVNSRLPQTNFMISDKMLKDMPHNLDGRAKKSKIVRNITICLLPIFIICVPLSIIIFMSLPLMYTILILFVCCMPVLFITTIKSTQYSAIIRLRDQIMLCDKISVEELASYNFGTLDVIQLVKQMISSGNLKGYELVDNKILVKDGVSYTKENCKISTPDTSYEGGYAGSLQDIVYCTNCGNKMTKDDKFCSKCGASLS
ncbi:MAG: zinc ribbon domain-containing protein [Bacillota bacterium]